MVGLEARLNKEYRYLQIDLYSAYILDSWNPQPNSPQYIGTGMSEATVENPHAAQGAKHS